jgi:hypothetical protein
MKRHNIILRFRINNGELLRIWEHKWGKKKGMEKGWECSPQHGTRKISNKCQNLIH